MFKDKGILTSGYTESDDPRGATIIYCMTPHGSSKAKRQAWHHDYAARFDGGKHLSVIVALSDDLQLPSRVLRSLSDKIPAGERATDFVPSPKELVSSSEVTIFTRARAGQGVNNSGYTCTWRK